MFDLVGTVFTCSQFPTWGRIWSGGTSSRMPLRWYNDLDLSKAPVDEKIFERFVLCCFCNGDLGWGHVPPFLINIEMIL